MPKWFESLMMVLLLSASFMVIYYYDKFRKKINS